MLQPIAQEAAERRKNHVPDNLQWFEITLRRLLAYEGNPDGDTLVAAFRPVMEFYTDRQQYDTALLLSERAIEIAQRCDRVVALRFFHHFSAVLLKNIGDTGRALSHAVMALKLAKQLQDPLAEARAWGQLASTTLNAGQFDDVLKYARTGLAVASSLGGAASQIKFQCNQLCAEAYKHMLSDVPNRELYLGLAIVAIENAVREAGIPRTPFEALQVNRCKLTQVYLYIRSGETEKAAQATAECRALADQLQSQSALLNAQIAEALLAVVQKDFDRAILLLVNLRDSFAGNDEMRGDVVSALAYAYDNAGRAAEAARTREQLYVAWQRKHIASTYGIVDQLVAQYPVDERQLLNAALMETIETIALSGEVHDDDTGKHVFRVGTLSALIAKELGLSDKQATEIEFAARLHDIGKIAIHTDILRKPGSLTPLERAEMEKHAAIGRAILERILHPVMAMAADIAGAHHERWDGRGYPNGLAGEKIPLSARIASVADVYDALTHARSYKQAWTAGQAIAEISRGREIAFDPLVHDAFLRVIHRLISLYGEEGLDTVLGDNSAENANVAARQFLTEQPLSLTAA